MADNSSDQDQYLTNPQGPAPPDLGPVVAPPPQVQAVNAQGQPVDPNAASDMDGLVATAPVSYANDSYAQGVAKADDANMQRAQNMTPAGNQGIWGLLPQNMQHGTLRNVLGAIGDAFLVGGGRAPSYADSINNRAMGLDMAGYSQHPYQAIERVAASGVPGSPEVAMRANEANQNLEMRKIVAQQQNNWHESMQADRDARTQAQQMITDDRLRGVYGGILDRAAATGDPNIYAAARQRVAAMVPKGSMINVDSEIPQQLSDYTKGYGMTSNQVQQSTDRAAQRAQSGQNAQTAAGARLGAADKYASSKNPTEASMAQAAMQRKAQGLPISTDEENLITKFTTHPGRGSRGLLVGGNGGQTGGRPQAPPNIPNGYRAVNGQYTPAQASRLPPKSAFQGTDGKWYHN